MAANLTPQFLEAEAEYKKAQTAEERLACLKKMYTLLPKHKASEKMQADLKTKISDAKETLDREKKSPKKAGVSYKIPRQGAGQYVILGAPNVGKSPGRGIPLPLSPHRAPKPCWYATRWTCRAPATVWTLFERCSPPAFRFMSFPRSMEPVWKSYATRSTNT